MILVLGICGAQALSQIHSRLYSDYESLLDVAQIVAETGQFLGFISADTSAEKSIMNFFGVHGSDVSPYSIFNPSSHYGGLSGPFSPFNWQCEFPPRVFKDSVFVAYLTENEKISPRISTYSLVGFLYDRAGLKGKSDNGRYVVPSQLDILKYVPPDK